MNKNKVFQLIDRLGFEYSKNYRIKIENRFFKFNLFKYKEKHAMKLNYNDVEYVLALPYDERIIFTLLNNKNIDDVIFCYNYEELYLELSKIFKNEIRKQLIKDII